MKIPPRNDTSKKETACEIDVFSSDGYIELTGKAAQEH